MTLEQEVHQFLKELPPTKFFFLYFVSHNLDYNSLKMLAQKLTDIVGFKIIIKTRFAADVECLCSEAAAPELQPVAAGAGVPGVAAGLLPLHAHGAGVPQPHAAARLAAVGQLAASARPPRLAVLG